MSANELDPKYAYIQVIYVTPYFDEKEMASRVTDFERNNNVRRFMYELPFTRSGKEHGSIEEQHKRRFIISSKSPSKRPKLLQNCKKTTDFLYLLNLLCYV